MELPIKVMLTLFVALVVASLVLLFAGDTMRAAREAMLGIENKDKIPMDQVIDKGPAPVSRSELVSLASECCKKGKELLQRDICFIIRGPVAPDATSGNLVMDCQLQGLPCTCQADSVNGLNSVAIYFNPNGNFVEIRR